MYLCLFLSLKRGTDQSTINNDGREIENLTTSCACGFMLWRCRLLFQRNYTVITRLSSPLTVQCPLLSYKHQYCLLDIFHTFLIDLILKISCQSDVVHARFIFIFSSHLNFLLKIVFLLWWGNPVCSLLGVKGWFTTKPCHKLLISFLQPSESPVAVHFKQLADCIIRDKCVINLHLRHSPSIIVQGSNISLLDRLW